MVSWIFIANLALIVVAIALYGEGSPTLSPEEIYEKERMKKWTGIVEKFLAEHSTGPGRVVWDNIQANVKKLAEYESRIKSVNLGNSEGIELLIEISDWIDEVVLWKEESELTVNPLGPDIYDDNDSNDVVNFVEMERMYYIHCGAHKGHSLSKLGVIHELVDNLSDQNTADPGPFFKRVVNLARSVAELFEKRTTKSTDKVAIAMLKKAADKNVLTKDALDHIYDSLGDLLEKTIRAEKQARMDQEQAMDVGHRHKRTRHGSSSTTLGNGNSSFNMNKQSENTGPVPMEQDQEEYNTYLK